MIQSSSVWHERLDLLWEGHTSHFEPFLFLAAAVLSLSLGNIPAPLGRTKHATRPFGSAFCGLFLFIVRLLSWI